MRVFVLSMLALLVLALAGLEVVMSALPDEPITPLQVLQGPEGRTVAPDHAGSALPADAAHAPTLVCSDETPFPHVTIDDGAAGY